MYIVFHLIHAVIYFIYKLTHLTPQGLLCNSLVEPYEYQPIIPEYLCDRNLLSRHVAPHQVEIQSLIGGMPYPQILGFMSENSLEEHFHRRCQMAKEAEILMQRIHASFIYFIIDYCCCLFLSFFLLLLFFKVL